MTAQFASMQSDLEQLAVGGEGIVYRLRSRPHEVFKEYKAPQLVGLNTDALRSLIAFAKGLQGADRDRLRDRTIWPSDLVAKGNQVVGFLMPALGPEYYRSYGLRAKPRQVLCDWNQLIYQRGPLPPHMVSEVPDLDFAARVELIKDLARTVDLLHRHNVVVGDMSGKNLVWGTNPTRVIIIDCDSFRFSDRPGVCIHKESPGWTDPVLQGAPTNMVSDIYKLGVAAYRALWRQPDGVVTSHLVTAAPRNEVPEDLASLIAASVSNTGRPTAADWVKSLDRAVRFGRRPTLAATRIATTSAPASTGSTAAPIVDPSGPISRPPRPRIRLS